MTPFAGLTDFLVKNRYCRLGHEPKILNDDGLPLLQDFSLPSPVSALRRFPGVQMGVRLFKRVAGKKQECAQKPSRTS